MLRLAVDEAGIGPGTLSAGEGLRRKRQTRFRAVDFGLNQHTRTVRIRDDGDIPDKAGADRFQPDGLPYSGGAGIDAPLANGLGLLARRLPAAGDVVEHIDDQFVLAVAQKAGDVEVKRHAAATMRAGQLAVDPNPRLIIHRAKMKAHVPALHGLGRFKHAPIPRVLHEAVVADAGKFALRAKRHGDGGVEIVAGGQSARVAVALLIHFKLPLAVERDPV